jgi:hypothetical protein
MPARNSASLWPVEDIEDETEFQAARGGRAASAGEDDPRHRLRVLRLLMEAVTLTGITFPSAGIICSRTFVEDGRGDPP